MADILDYFQLLKKNNTIGSSYLFIGNDFVCVFDIIKTVTCSKAETFCDTCWDCNQLNQKSHPDLFIAEADPVTIRIEKIREAQKFLNMRPYRLSLKILVISAAQNLGTDAANAFLKTLEEPPKNSFIAVCASKQESLLPTIISRCRKIYLPWVREEISERSLADAISFLRKEKIKFNDRVKFSACLWALIVLIRDQTQNRLGRTNNRLLSDNACETILRSYSVERLIQTLNTLLRVYECAGTINENLALTMVRDTL